MVLRQLQSSMGIIVSLTTFAPSSGATQQASVTPHFMLELYPDKVKAKLEQHEKQVLAVSQHVTAAPFHLIVPTINRWVPGTSIRAAFNGGDAFLRSKIEDAANEWTKPGIANIHFQFKNANGDYLEWDFADQQYNAEIRIGFLSADASGDGGGTWSLVGRDSIDPGIAPPNVISFNLDSFDKSLPSDWRATVIHEFGHVLGFQHEHQNPAGGCDFRFDDDPGYIPSLDPEGWYGRDSTGRRPGLYTYLGGYANYLPKDKVDSNLRSLPVSSAFLIGPFDKKSIMKYFFAAFMFLKETDSPCYTDSETRNLSDQDKVGAQRAYPSDPILVGTFIGQQKQILAQMAASPNASSAIIKNVKAHLETFK